MKKLFLIIIALAGAVALWQSVQTEEAPQAIREPVVPSESKTEAPQAAEEQETIVPIVKTPEEPVFAEPLANSSARITKKPFGIWIDPASSPISPERFRGYHSGTDFEVTPEEIGTPVMVHAICSGPVVQARNVSGYGGVVVQSCTVQGKNISVLYGHVALSTLQHSVGAVVDRGSTLVMLGEQGPDTALERKHLHLGITRSATVDIRGYVQSRSELERWRSYESQ